MTTLLVVNAAVYLTIFIVCTIVSIRCWRAMTRPLKKGEAWCQCGAKAGPGEGGVCEACYQEHLLDEKIAEEEWADVRFATPPTEEERVRYATLDRLEEGIRYMRILEE